MKKVLLLFIVLISIAYYSHAQAKIDRENEIGQDGIVVFQGEMKIRSTGRKFSFAFAKGDKVLLKCTTEKDKKLKYVCFTNIRGSKLWEQYNPASFTKEINIKEEGVYTLELTAKGMGSRLATINIIRKPGITKDFNTAWMKNNTYKGNEVKYSIDSVVGYKEPVITQDTLKVFDKYLYKNIEMVNYENQILAQMGIHNSQAKPFKLGLNPTKVPKNAKLKGYTYSLSSVMGGKKHWVIADVTVSVGAMFLSPVGAFAAHGAMALIGPQPGNEPIQYFLTDHESDLKVVREIYSPHNTGRKVTNVYKDGVSEVVGLFSGKAKKAVKGTKVHEYNEGELHFNQKGKVTNMLIYSATPPSKELMILANPDYTHAKNVKLKGSAIYYAPVYKNVKAEEKLYQLNTVPVEKTTTKYTRETTYGSIKN